MAAKALKLSGNGRDLLGQLFKRRRLFGPVLIMVVHAAHAIDDMAEAPLGMIARHPGAGQAAHGARAVMGEHQIAAINHRHGLQHRLRRSA